ncbi:MAG: hypothetical protein ACI4GV_07545 [Acutalibacteraceae bacterium]
MGIPGGTGFLITASITAVLLIAAIIVFIVFKATHKPEKYRIIMMLIISVLVMILVGIGVYILTVSMAVNMLF